jgi:hypothetical protein
MTSDVQEAPLQEAPLPPEPMPAPAPKLTGREKRWQRRRRRRVFEEVLGWILVPIIIASIYWGVKAGLNAAGTSPTAIVQGIRALISGGAQQP